MLQALTMKKLNVILLCINLALMLAFVVLWLIPCLAKYGRDRKQAEALGMKPFMKRPPFTVFVEDGFPRTGGFVIGVDGMPLMFKCTGIEARRSGAKICIGTEHEIGATFTLEPEIKLIETTLVNGDTYFADTNADGSYDKRMSLGIRGRSLKSSNP